jgi:aspartokinase
MMTADPRLVSNARVIDISYQEASGTFILRKYISAHLQPVMSKGIPVWIKILFPR